MATNSKQDVVNKVVELFDELYSHEGFSEMRVMTRLLKRGQKEIIIHFGNEYRFVVDFAPQS